MKDNFVKCGFVVTDSGEITEVYGFSNSNGTTELYYNNDSYGIVGLWGFKEEVEVTSMSDGDEANMLRMLQHGERNAKAGIILLENGLMTIESVYLFKGEIQPLQTNSSDFDAKPIDYFIDTVDIDEDCDEYDMVAGLFGAV